MRNGILIFLMLLFCLCSPILAQQPAPNALYFVQITDPHWGCEPTIDSTLRVVEEINSLPFAFNFVALTGDVFCDNVDPAIAQRGREALQKLSAPVYILAGNHDFVGSNAATYAKIIGQLNYAVEQPDYRLLCISSVDSTYNPSEKVLAWVNETLKVPSERPVLLFHHQPFTDAFYTTEELAIWKALLQQSAVQAVFSGHLHRDALIWHEQIPEFTAAPLLSFEGRQPSYRLYEYKQGRMSYQTFYLNPQ